MNVWKKIICSDGSKDGATFYAVFGNKLPNNSFAHLCLGLAVLLEILDPPLISKTFEM